MEKSYQLVAWTDKGRVRMLPSEVNTFLHEELDKINRLSDRIRYNTCHEVHDLLEWSCAYEKLALQLLDLGQVEDAFRQLSQAALCCTASWNNWEDTEWGYVLCKPLRGRFFAMFCASKDLVRKYPMLQYVWEDSGLQEACDHLTDAYRCFELECYGDSGEVREARNYNRALQFGKNEIYRRRSPLIVKHHRPRSVKTVPDAQNC